MVVNEMQSIGFEVYTSDQSGITFGGQPSLALALIQSAQEAGALAPVLGDEFMLELLPSIEIGKKRSMEMLMLFIERVDAPPTHNLH
jgi:hypothetical protein